METLPLSRIRTDAGCQPRAGISSEVVDDYAALLIAGTELPAVVVFHDGAEHYLADGYHRFEAHRKIKRVEISADVRQGTLRDAVLFSLGANQAHGLRRTNGDKRRVVERMLRDEEWSRWSDNRIADHVGVSQPFVSAVRREIDPDGTQKRLKSERITKAGRTVNTANIGRKPRDPKPSVSVTRTAEHAQDVPDDALPVRQTDPEFDSDAGEAIESVPAEPVAPAVQDQSIAAITPGGDGAPHAADGRESLGSDRQVPEPASVDEPILATLSGTNASGPAEIVEADAGASGGAGTAAPIPAAAPGEIRYLVPRHYRTPEGMTAFALDPNDPQSFIEAMVSMGIRGFGLDGAKGTTGADAADDWPDGKPLITDHISRCIDELISFEARFRSKHGPANPAGMSEAEAA